MSEEKREVYVVIYERGRLINADYDIGLIGVYSTRVKAKQAIKDHKYFGSDVRIVPRLIDK
jgi:hypothetical protein